MDGLNLSVADARVETVDPNTRSQMLDGMRDSLPILLAVVPFAAVFGALAVESGLSFGQMVLASMTIFAGASQYAMIDLMGQEVPAWSIVLTVFAINFRHVLYSASLSRHLKPFSTLQKMVALFLLVDPQFAAAEARATRQILRPAYYFGYATPVFITWMSGNILGGLFGGLMENPAQYGIDFILPLYFVGLIVGFRSRPRFVPILVVATAVSLVTYFTLGSPWHITVGGFAGLVLAALMSKPKDMSIG